LSAPWGGTSISELYIYLQNSKRTKRILKHRVHPDTWDCLTLLDVEFALVYSAAIARTFSPTHKYSSCARIREGDPKRWSTVPVTALGSWEKPVPRDHMYQKLVIFIICTRMKMSPIYLLFSTTMTTAATCIPGMRI
jgi:hypothetical protein